MCKKHLLLTIAAIFAAVSAYAQPSNDNCNNATPLDCTVENGTNVGATTGPEDSYAPADICAISLENTVWYSYTATATGTVDVNITNINCGSGFGLQFGVFTGPCGGPYTPVGTCVSGYPPPPLSFPAVSGQSYYIVVDGDAGDACTWDMNICPPGCNAYAGTTTNAINGGNVGSPIVLCPGDCYTINSNDDYVLPTPVAGEVSELMYAIYSCAPPANPDINVDACYTGFLWTGEDFNDCNDAGSILLGAGLGPQVWYVPVTADDSDNNGNPNGVINVDNNGDGCFDYGTPIEITYTNPITFNATENCSAGTVSVTITGGSSEFYGGSYNITNTGAGTVTGAPVSHGGTITITGLLDGDMYSFDIVDQYGCAYSFSGGPFSGPDDPTITPAGPFCESDGTTNLTAATAGGTWSGTGITNAASGTFDPSVAGPGSWTITYSLTTPCPTNDTEVIVVNPDADATITPAGPYCENDPAVNLVGADPGGTWSGTGITNPATGTFDPGTAGAGTWTITYTIGGACGDVQTYDIVVNPNQDATITPVGPFCPGDPAINLVGADPGGTWSGTGITNPATGTFDPTTAGPGTWTITYTLGGACGDVQTYDIVVNNVFDATITPAGPFCPGDPAVNLVGADPGGTWSGTGITNPATGTFDPATAGPGTWTITYTIGGACGDVQTYDVVVNPGQDATITPAGPFCPGDPAINLVGADPGGTWSGTGITNPATGTFDPATAGPGTWTITYTIGGACGDVQTTDIVVNNLFDATITPAGPFCESDPTTNLVGADPGGTWSGTGITNPATGTFDPATAGPGTWTIAYTISGTCGDVQTYDVVVNPDLDATITPVGPFCPTDPAIVMVGADPGGTWSGTGITNPATGAFDPATAGVGTWTVTYTIGGACGDIQTFDVVINNVFDATITPVGPYCQSDPAVNLVGADPGGTWSGTGITNPATGTFDPATAGPGTWTITYTIGGACGDVQTTDITINPDLDATITPVGPFCPGDPTVNLVGADPGGTWSGTGITNPATGTFDPAVAGAGTWTITYTIGGACGDVQTYDIVVNDVFDATITPAGPFCPGDPAVNLVGADPGGTWSGTGITNPATGTFDPATAGPGTWTITYTIGGACGDVQTYDILVNPVLDATITPAGPFCPGDPTFDFVGADPGGTWSGTGITNPATGTFDPAVAGTGTWTITYTIAGACGDVQTYDVVVNTLDDPGITAVGPFCLGSPAVTLVAATTPGTWSGTGITDPVNGTFDIITAGSGSHVITYVTNDLCPNTGTTTIDILDPLNVAALQDETICAGESSDLSAVANGGDGNYTYTWTDQNAAVVGSGTNITVSPSVTTIYTVTVTDGCTTPPADDAVTITVIPIPVIDFTVDNAIGCSPLDVTFTNNSIPQGTNCTWDFGDGLSSTGCGSVNHQYIDVGCYDVTLTVSESGCTNTQTQVNMVCIIEDPIADFTFTPESADLFDPEFFFTNTSQYATSYSWDFDDGAVSSLENPTHLYPYEEGEYMVCLTAYNDYNCVSEICKPILVNEGLIYYMPNTFTPDGDEYNQSFKPVFTSGYDPQDFNLLIFDRWGEVIWESNDASIGWDGTFNGKLVQSGTYVWKVEFKVLVSDERVMQTGHVNVLR